MGEKGYHLYLDISQRSATFQKVSPRVISSKLEIIIMSEKGRIACHWEGLTPRISTSLIREYCVHTQNRGIDLTLRGTSRKTAQVRVVWPSDGSNPVGPQDRQFMEGFMSIGAPGHLPFPISPLWSVGLHCEPGLYVGRLWKIRSFSRA